MAVLCVIMALWLVGAAWAIYSGFAMRRRSAVTAEQADRLTTLLESAPALPVVVRADGRIDAPDRLAGLLGLEKVPKFISPLFAAAGGLKPKDGDALGLHYSAALEAGKRFTRTVCATRPSPYTTLTGPPA